MARKKLLTESEIRRFMKLATIGTVGDEKIKSLSLNEQDELEDVEADFAAEPGGDELDVDAEVAMDEPMPEPMGDDLEGDMGEVSPELEAAATELAQGFASVIEDILGVEVSVDGEADEMPEVPEGDEEVSLDAETSLEGPMGDEEISMSAEEEVEEPLPGGRDMYESQNALVNAVAKRVAARLVKENKKSKLTDELTERIFQRLTQK
jgi:hypothetical protein